MRINWKKILSASLALTMCFQLSGCKQEKEQPPEDSLVYMKYGIGVDEVTDNYNSALYGMNGNDVRGADPGCFYVSEEEDPKYGGYFYMYPTSFATSDLGAKFSSDYYKEQGITNLVAACYRSKDLYHWDRCGALEGGYVLPIYKDDWCQDLWWAPEVIRNPADGKYYLYFTAMAPKNYGVKGISNSDLNYDRLYIGMAVSDSPMGPFDLIYDIDKDTGKQIPTINFQLGNNVPFAWGVIDVNPFFDDNGDFYLYFRKHVDDHYSHFSGIWGVKMQSMTHADYSTLSCLTQPGYYTASNKPGVATEIETGEEFYSTEGNCNEGPFMIKHKGKYYITYSQFGYGNISYAVMQAVSDSPLSGFVKMDAKNGNPVLDGSQFGYMNGTGHHAFAQKGDELFIIYHRHASAQSYELAGSRSICADRAHWVTNSDGLDVLTASGPTRSLQWLDEDVSGYRNLAKTANIKVSSGTGIEYLNDEILPFYAVAADLQFKTKDEKTTITLKWDKPVSVSSIMVYNSRELNYAFTKIADLRFRLAEKPSWASKDYDWAVIKDLKLPDRYCDPESEEYITCPSTVAEFDPITVSEIQITLNGKDKYVTEDKQGDPNLQIALSEIVVLGGVN